ncbi:MAG: GerW family sporulation protein [Clostridia bacterium]|nr:GerW family sporulation protein [Clostridia bacterium]
MENHPIEGLMRTTMESLKQMIDVNTIVGDPVETPDGITIIPISRVSFGFASGGGEYKQDNHSRDEGGYEDGQSYPFAGGTGAGVSVQPVAFMIVGRQNMKLLSVEQNANIFENLVGLSSKLIDKMEHGNSKDRKSKNNKNNNSSANRNREDNDDES